MSTHRHIDPSSRNVNIKLNLLNPTIICRPIEYFETPLQLPVVASYLNKLQFIEQINDRVTWDSTQWKYSPGILAQLLVLLPFVSANKKVSLSRIHEAYAGIDLELLVGEPIDPATLNDDMFGRVLDRIYEAGCSSLFSSIALSVRLTFNLSENFILHSDTTSHVLYGDYECDAGEKPQIKIIPGYSKQKRDDLNQIMTGAVTDGDGLILYSKVLDGNTADCSYNNLVVDELREIFGEGFKKYSYIADSKLLNKPNVEKLFKGPHPIRFISRIPENFHKKLAEKARTQAYTENKWAYQGPCCSHPGKTSTEYWSCAISESIYGHPCTVNVYRSSERERFIEKKVDKAKDELKSVLQELEKREFACEPDALAEKERFLKDYLKSLIYPELELVCKEEIKKPVGRPAKNPKPPKIIRNWKIQTVDIKRNEEIIEKRKRKAATFSLLTNIPQEEMGSADVLITYKGQGKVEQNFKILKEPLMAATIFLEKDTRIAALMTMLYFSALLHGILRLLTHIELEKLPEPPRINSNNRPLIRPTSDTMIWLLSLFKIRSSDEGYQIYTVVSNRRDQVSLLLKLTRFDLDFIGPC